MDGGGDAPQFSSGGVQEAASQDTENRQALETLINLQNSFLSNIVSSQQPKPTSLDSPSSQGPCVIYYTGPDGELLQGVEQGIPVPQVSAIPTSQIQTVPVVQVQNVSMSTPFSAATTAQGLQDVAPSSVTQQSGTVPMVGSQLNTNSSVTYMAGAGQILCASGDGLVTIPEGLVPVSNSGMATVPGAGMVPAPNSSIASIPGSSMVSGQGGTISASLTSLLTTAPASASAVSTSGIVSNQTLSSGRVYTPIAPAPSLPRATANLATAPSSNQFVVVPGSSTSTINQTVGASVVDTTANVQPSVVTNEAGPSVVVAGKVPSPSDEDKARSAAEKKRCQVCQKVFSSSQGMLRHLRVLHGVDTGPFPSKCAVPGCSANYRCVRELVTHYSAVHQANVEVEDMTFDSLDQFLTWKKQEEAVTGAKFAKNTGSRKSSKSHQYLYFSCNRNGSSKSHLKPEDLAKPRKRRKPRGSVKLNSVCLARMSAKIAVDGLVTVRYVMTHTNHVLPSGNVHAVIPCLQDARSENQSHPSDREGETASVVTVDGEDIPVSARPSMLSNHSSPAKRPAVLERQIARINDDIGKLQAHLSSDNIDKIQACHIETVLQSLLLHCGLEGGDESLGNGMGKRKSDVGVGGKMKKMKVLHVCETCGMPGGRGRGRRVGRKPGRKPKQQQASQDINGLSEEQGRQKARENPYARPTLSQRGTLRSNRYHLLRRKMEPREETEIVSPVQEAEPLQQTTDSNTGSCDRVEGPSHCSISQSADVLQSTTSSVNTADQCEDSCPSEHLASALLELASHSKQDTEL